MGGTMQSCRYRRWEKCPDSELVEECSVRKGRKKKTKDIKYLK